MYVFVIVVILTGCGFYPPFSAVLPACQEMLNFFFGKLLLREKTTQLFFNDLTVQKSCSYRLPVSGGTHTHTFTLLFNTAALGVGRRSCLTSRG